MTELIQPSFAKGELSPNLYGRVDTSVYRVGLRTALNVFIHPSGGVSNRPGTYFTAPVIDHAVRGRLIEFEFSDQDTYVLEFGEKKLRFIRNDAQVLETGVAISGITNADPAVLTTAAPHGFTDGQDVFVTGVVGMPEINDRWYTVRSATATTFELDDKLFVGFVNSTNYGVYTSGGTVARVYEIATPYPANVLRDLKYVQSADVITFAHRQFPVYELRRLDVTNWEFREAAFTPTTSRPNGLNVVPNTTGTENQRYTVTAINPDTLAESLAGISPPVGIAAITAANPVQVTTSVPHNFTDGQYAHLYDLGGANGMGELNNRDFQISVVDATNITLNGEDGTSHTPYVSGGQAAELHYRILNGASPPDNTVSWVVVEGALKYRIYREDNGVFGFIGETTSLSFVDKNILPDFNLAPPQHRDVFWKPGEYPDAVGFYEQRQCFGGTDNNPDTQYYSRIGLYRDFTRSAPTQDDDAITTRLAAEKVNRIRHFTSENDNLVLTLGAEWRVNAGSDAGFSASTLRQKEQSQWGTANIRPLTVGAATLFVQRGKRLVRSLGYSLQVDKYVGTNVTILADHLFEDLQLVEWTSSTSPVQLVLAIREDGVLCCMTFDPEQEVIAWTRWETDGEFESVAAVYTQQEEKDETGYFIVQRRINGNTVRYIERTASRRLVDVRDAYFVDCGLTYDTPYNVEYVATPGDVLIGITGHPFQVDDLVDLSDILWQTTLDDLGNEIEVDQLDGRFKVKSISANEIAVVRVNGQNIDFSDWVPYASGGKARKPQTTFSGLDHLEGEAVAVLADGNVVTGKTVASGKIELGFPASRVHVGLQFISDVETLDIEAPSGVGTIQGKKKKIGELTIRMRETRGLLVGPDSTKMDEIKQRFEERYDDPIAMFTGDHELPLPPQWNSHGRIFIRQLFPLPMTVLAVIPDLFVED